MSRLRVNIFLCLAGVVVLNALYLRQPRDMRVTKELSSWLPIVRVEVVNAASLDDHHAWITGRHSIQGATTVAAEEACHHVKYSITWWEAIFEQWSRAQKLR